MHTGITIIGLGNCQGVHFSNKALPILQGASQVYLKSACPGFVAQQSAAVKWVSPTIQPIDGLSDGYQALAQELVAAVPVVYAVPGDPLIDEASTPIIQQVADQANIPLTIIAAEAILPATLRALGITPGLGLQLMDATLLCSYHHPPLEPHRPALITGLYHADLVEPLKRVLQTIYEPQTLLASFAGDRPLETTLDNLDDAPTCVFISPQANSPGLTRFQEIIAHLRAPNGCPWDREQTHHTLRPYLLEEAYEVLAALDAANPAELADELGDLLLQIVLHAQIATEAKTFQMTDIINNISRKMVRRHPHVFADTNVRNSAEVKVNWEAIKAQERAAKGETEAEPSVMDGIGLTLPALAQTLNISKKAVKMGFEWDDVQGVLRKLVEEAHEIAAATTPAEIEAEIGDFLFTAVNLARKMNVDAESALRACNARFRRRFRRLEMLAREQNLVLPEIDKQTWFKLWQQAKKDVAHLEKR